MKKNGHIQRLFSEQDYLGYFGVIYKITNILNNKIYIGQSVNILERILSHETTAFNEKDSNHNNPIYRSFRKHGLSNFKIEIIDQANDIDSLNEKEIYYINLYNSLVDSNKGYNLDKGGKNGKKSEYTRHKMSLSQRNENNPSFGRYEKNALRALSVIDLDTLKIYGSMIDAATELYGDPSVLKQISKITSVNNNRLSYKGKHFARFDDRGNIIIKLTVAELLNLDTNDANGKSYITRSVSDLRNTLSKKA